MPTPSKIQPDTEIQDSVLRAIEKRRKIALNDEELDLLTNRTIFPETEDNASEIISDDVKKALLPVASRGFGFSCLRHIGQFREKWQKALNNTEKDGDFDRLLMQPDFHLIGPDMGTMAGSRSLAALLRDPRTQNNTWLIDQIFRNNAVAMITGLPKSGKTHFTRQIIYAIATGTPLLGAYPARRGQVIYISNENADADFAAQMMADFAGLGGSQEHLQLLQNNVRMYYDRGGMGKITLNATHKQGLHGEEIDTNDSFPRLLHDVAFHNKRARDLNLDPVRLVIIDPLANYHNFQENDATEMSELHRRLRIFGKLANVAILVIHHSIKDDSKYRSSKDVHRSIRGSVALFGMLDTSIILRRGRGKATPNKWDVDLYTTLRAGQSPGDLKYTIEIEDDPTTHTAAKITWTKVKNDDPPPPDMDGSSPDGDGNPPDGDGSPKRGRKRKKKDDEPPAEPPAEPVPDMPAPDFKDDIPYPE